MGQCTFCNNKAGFLRSYHKECKNNHENGKKEIIFLVSEAGLKAKISGELKTSIEKISNENKIDKKLQYELVIKDFKNAVDTAFEDGILSESEESSLGKLQDYFSLSKDDLDRNEAFAKMVKGAILRDILEEILPNRINIDGDLPFNLQKKRKNRLGIPGCELLRRKKRTHYVGGSQGLSIRIAKGLYYRTGSFKGEKVQTSETVHVDTGLLGITNKHLYFAGSFKRFRIVKLLRLNPFLMESECREMLKQLNRSRL